MTYSGNIHFSLLKQHYWMLGTNARGDLTKIKTAEQFIQAFAQGPIAVLINQANDSNDANLAAHSYLPAWTVSSHCERVD